MDDNRKYAIYSRKSKFTGKGESIENQIEICKQHLHNNYQTSDEDYVVFEDEGYSGANTNRKSFQAMMERCRQKEFKGVICYRLDRISRNTFDFIKTLEELKAYKVSFISVNDNIDVGTPMGKAMMMITSVFAELERSIIAERITDNLHELAKYGRWLGGVTPTGYKSIQVVGSVSSDGKERMARQLEQIPEEIEVVKKIYKKFIEVKSLSKTETYLMNSDIRSKNDNYYTRFTIKSILRNPVYLIADEDAWNYFRSRNIEVHNSIDDFNGVNGILAYNKTKQTAGKTNELNDMKNWIVAIGRHEGIISGADWVKVQQILYENKDKSYHKPKSNVSLLSGVVRCGHCGSYMRPKLTQRRNKDGELIYDYICELREKSKSQKCSIKRVTGNILDMAVCDAIKNLTADESTLAQYIKSSRKNMSSAFKDIEKEIFTLEQSLKQINVERKELRKKLLSAKTETETEFVFTMVTELSEREESIKAQIAERKQLVTSSNTSEAEFASLVDMLLSFSNSMDNYTLEEKRSIIKQFVKKVTWDGENANIVFFGAEDGSIDLSKIEPKGEQTERNPHALPLPEKNPR